MTSFLKRTFAVLGVAALTAAGVAITAAPAQALPGSFTITEGCDIPSGGSTVDGVSITIDNSDDEVGSLDYSVLVDYTAPSARVGTVAAGDSETFVLALPEDDSTAVQIYFGDVLQGGDTITTNCVGNYSPDVTGSIVSSCLLDSGGIIPPSAGVLLTADNSEGDGPADYFFTVGDVDLESGTIAAGGDRLRSTSLEEDTPTHVEVGSIDEEGDYRVLAEADITLNCIADTPVITSPTDGQVLIGSPSTITGTGTAGDQVAVFVIEAAVYDAAFEEAGPAARAVPVTVPTVDEEGVLIFEATVDENGEFAVQTPLAIGEYVTFAIAARDATDESDASVSGQSNIVRFSVAAAPVVPVNPAVPAGTGVAGGKTLASTGLAPVLPISIAGGLLLAGAAVFMLRRRSTEK